MWTLEAQLLATIADLLASANWQRSGGRGPRPKPIPRPGTVAKRVVGAGSFDRAELDARLAAHVGPRRPRRHTTTR